MALLMSVRMRWPFFPTVSRNRREMSPEPPAISRTRWPSCTLARPTAKRFQMRCRPTDMRSFMMSYLLATEVKTPATFLAFSVSSTVWKPKWVFAMVLLLCLQSSPFDRLRANGHSFVAAGAGFFQLIQVILPHAFLVFAQFVQVLPGIQAAVVAVVEYQFDGVAACGLDVGKHHIAFADLQRF